MTISLPKFSGKKWLLTFVSGGKEFDTNRLPSRYVYSVLCNLKEKGNIPLHIDLRKS